MDPTMMQQHFGEVPRSGINQKPMAPNMAGGPTNPENGAINGLPKNNSNNAQDASNNVSLTSVSGQNAAPGAAAAQAPSVGANPSAGAGAGAAPSVGAGAVPNVGAGAYNAGQNASMASSFVGAGGGALPTIVSVLAGPGKTENHALSGNQVLDATKRNLVHVGNASERNQISSEVLKRAEQEKLDQLNKAKDQESKTKFSDWGSQTDEQKLNDFTDFFNQQANAMGALGGASGNPYAMMGQAAASTAGGVTNSLAQSKSDPNTTSAHYAQDLQSIQNAAANAPQAQGIAVNQADPAAANQSQLRNSSFGDVSTISGTQGGGSRRKQGPEQGFDLMGGMGYGMPMGAGQAPMPGIAGQQMRGSPQYIDAEAQYHPDFKNYEANEQGHMIPVYKSQEPGFLSQLQAKGKALGDKISAPFKEHPVVRGSFNPSVKKAAQSIGPAIKSGSKHIENAFNKGIMPSGQPIFRGSVNPTVKNAAQKVGQAFRGSPSSQEAIPEATAEERNTPSRGGEGENAFYRKATNNLGDKLNSMRNQSMSQGSNNPSVKKSASLDTIPEVNEEEGKAPSSLEEGINAFYKKATNNLGEKFNNMRKQPMVNGSFHPAVKNAARSIRDGAQGIYTGIKNKFQTQDNPATNTQNPKAGSSFTQNNPFFDENNPEDQQKWDAAFNSSKDRQKFQNAKNAFKSRSNPEPMPDIVPPMSAQEEQDSRNEQARRMRINSDNNELDKRFGKMSPQQLKEYSASQAAKRAAVSQKSSRPTQDIELPEYKAPAPAPQWRNEQGKPIQGFDGIEFPNNKKEQEPSLFDRAGNTFNNVKEASGKAYGKVKDAYDNIRYAPFSGPGVKERADEAYAASDEGMSKALQEKYAKRKEQENAFRPTQDIEMSNRRDWSSQREDPTRFKLRKEDVPNRYKQNPYAVKSGINPYVKDSKLSSSSINTDDDTPQGPDAYDPSINSYAHGGNVHDKDEQFLTFSRQKSLRNTTSAFKHEKNLGRSMESTQGGRYLNSDDDFDSMDDDIRNIWK